MQEHIRYIFYSDGLVVEIMGIIASSRDAPGVPYDDRPRYSALTPTTIQVETYEEVFVLYICIRVITNRIWICEEIRPVDPQPEESKAVEPQNEETQCEEAHPEEGQSVEPLCEETRAVEPQHNKAKILFLWSFSMRSCRVPGSFDDQ